MAKIKLQVLLVPSYFASVPTALVDPHLTKRFLHLADPSIELGNIDKDIDSRYRKLYPDESPLSIEKLQDNDNCDLDPEFRIQDVLTNGDVLRIVVHNIFHQNPLSISSNTGTPIMSKSFDVIQSTPLYPSEHALLGDTTLPMTRGYPSSNNFRPQQEFFETPHNNRLLLPPQHQQQFQSQQLQQNQQFQQNQSQHNPQFPVVAAETSKLVVRKGRRRGSSRADFDESNISLPPPDSRPDRIVPTKRVDTTKSNSSISGRRITSGMLTMPHQHPEPVDQDNLFGSATRDLSVPHSVTISDFEYEDVDDSEVPLVKKKGRPAKKKRGPKPKIVAPTHNMSESDETLPQPKPKRRIGRPKGSKNRQPRTVDDTLSKSEMIEMIKSSMNDNAREHVVLPPAAVVKTPAQAAIIKSLEITMNDTPKSSKRTAKPVGRPPNKVAKPSSKRNPVASSVTENKSKLLDPKLFNSKDINDTGVSVEASNYSNADSHGVTGVNGGSSHVNSADVSSLTLEKNNGQTSKSDIVVDSNEEEDIYVDTSSTLGRLYMKMKNFESKIKSHTSDLNGYPKKMSPEPSNDDNVINSAILNPTINLVMHMRNAVPNVPVAPANRVTPSKPASTYTPKPGSRPRGRPPKNPRVTPVKKDTKASRTEASAAKRAPNTIVESSSTGGATAVSNSIPIGSEITESISSHTSTSTSATVANISANQTKTTQYSVIPNSNSNPHAGLEIGVSQLHSNNNNNNNNNSNNNNSNVNNSNAAVEPISNRILLENFHPSGSPPTPRLAAPQIFVHPIPTSSFFSNQKSTTYTESEAMNSKVNAYCSPSTSATSTIAAQPVEHKNGSTLSNLVHQEEQAQAIHNVDVTLRNDLGDPSTSGTSIVGALQREAIVEPTNNVFIENSGSDIVSSTTIASNFAEKILSAKVKEADSNKLVGIDRKKRVNDSSSGESSDDGSSDSEAESKKKPRLVASIPSLLRRSQSPISAVVSTAKNMVADTNSIPQQAKTPAKVFPSFNDWVASKPPVGPGATAILNRSPSAFGPEKSTVRKPILSSLEDLATRGVPDVKDSTTKEGSHGAATTKKNVFEDDDDSDEDETSSDNDGSDDDFSDESGANDGSEKFLSMKRAVARKNKAKKNLFSSLRR